MNALDTSVLGEALYQLHYRCGDACQDPDDPYGRKPTHRCYEVRAYPITKVTATRIYFRPGLDCPKFKQERSYFVQRADIDDDGSVYHRGLRCNLYLTSPEIPARRAPAEPKTVAELRREMADAHPDRGGDRDTFQTARRRYLAAKAVAS